VSELRPTVVLALLATIPGVGHTNDFHGSIGGGGSLVLAGDNGGRRTRLDAELELSVGRYGGLVAWRAFDRDHHGLVCVGLVYAAAASRPRLVLDLHADVGADLDIKAPLAGGGLRTTVGIVGSLGIALDTGVYVVVDGIDTSRAVIETSAMAVARW
jgi:hypothetical protein